jgi:hypothetical protein
MDNFEKHKEWDRKRVSIKEALQQLDLAERSIEWAEVKTFSKLKEELKSLTHFYGFLLVIILDNSVLISYIVNSNPHFIS